MSRFRLEVHFHGQNDVHQTIETWPTQRDAEKARRDIVASASRDVPGSVLDIASIEVVLA